MLWRRQRKLIGPANGPTGIWNSHFQMPIVHAIGEKHYRLFFTGRSRSNKSYGFFADLDLHDGVEIASMLDEPILEPGMPGAFDSDGAMPSCIVQWGKELWLYYVGWQKLTERPFKTSIGLAISRDGGVTFERWRSNPVLGVQPVDPFAVSQPFIVQAPSGFVMYYTSVTEWRRHGTGFESIYAIKLARSFDGLRWVPGKKEIIPLGEEEGGLSRPAHLIEKGIHHIWFGRRGWRNFRHHTESAYHLTHAASRDGETWRCDGEPLAFVNPPQDGDWDSMMQSYPAVVCCGEDVLCFYSGNGFGQAGIGYATLEGGVSSLRKASDTAAMM